MEVDHHHQPWRSLWKMDPFEFEPLRLYSSNSVASTLHTTETTPDKSRPRSYRLSFYQEQFGRQSSTNPLYALDPKIEITLRSLQKTRNIVVNISSSVDSVIYSDQLSTDISASGSNIFAEPGQMENNDRTLKELATPDVVYQPWCIQYPQLEPAQTRGPPQALEGIPRSLFHNEAVRDPGRLHQKECGLYWPTIFQDAITPSPPTRDAKKQEWP
ncbi:hypothetical protein CR513_10670, partial [Mucuna pruriens]